MDVICLPVPFLQLSSFTRPLINERLLEHMNKINTLTPNPFSASCGSKKACTSPDVIPIFGTKERTGMFCGFSFSFTAYAISC